ncbi:VanW family protein [Ureibacillus sp. 179-F W5.1 NHS]|uniref:VanW family protein n=1 Tax=Ureibacillus sp. 179-F W5.1 NHS TaxID=3374297 RepID=UPI0038797442
MGVKRLFIMVIICSLALVGCSETFTSKEQLKERIVELEQKIEELEREKEQGDAAEEIIEKGTSTIQLVDPSSKEIIYSFTPKELGYNTNKNSERYKKEIEQLAKELARGTDNKRGYDQRMVLDKLNENGELVKGKPQVILKEKELVEKILAASNTGGNVELPIYITESGYSQTEIADLDNVVIASYTTYFNSSDVGRSSNIKLSANAISHVIVGVEDIFSFNITVGPRTKETGYQPALEIVNGEFEMGIGGGICQTSSTLFNAVDQLGVHYVERHHHSIDIGYVPKGRDATVSYDSLDFRFQNTTGVPFMIQATTTKDSITIKLTTSEKYADLLKN